MMTDAELLEAVLGEWDETCALRIIAKFRADAYAEGYGVAYSGNSGVR